MTNIVKYCTLVKAAINFRNPAVNGYDPCGHSMPARVDPMTPDRMGMVTSVSKSQSGLFNGLSVQGKTDVLNTFRAISVTFEVVTVAARQLKQLARSSEVDDDSVPNLHPIYYFKKKRKS